ncbi:MAG: TonB-dependent receptor [Bacteroidales bacterium]|nr:TonB-dependent receptor [Bacteroidales bacterium]
MKKQNLPELPESLQKLKEYTRNDTRSKDWTGTLYYQGNFSDRWQAYADISYNYFDNDLANSYQQDAHTLFDNTYKEERKLLGFNLDLTYALSDKMSLNFGYSNQYRKYESESQNKESLLDYSENRHQVFGYFNYQPSDKWSFEIGTGVEYLRREASTDKEQYWNLLPYANVNYNFSDNLNARLRYKSSMQYPTLAQLNPVALQIDSLMTSQGNPYLKSSVIHTLALDVNLWNRVTITPKLEWNSNQIGDLITEGKDHHHLLSPINLKMRKFSVDGVYDQPLNDYFSLSNSLQYYYTKVKYDGESHSGGGWLVSSGVDYFNPKHTLMLQLNYARTVSKEMYIQGYQMVDLDAWSFTAMKQFFKGRASVMLTYTLPMEWGLRKSQKREIQAPNYTERMNISLKPYRSMFMIHLSYRFGSGKVNFFRKKSEILKEERIKRTVDF